MSTDRVTARKRHACDSRSSIYCADLIAPGEEYWRTTVAPWVHDAVERVGIDDEGNPIIGTVRIDRHPDGGHRGWRTLRTCAACHTNTMEVVA